MDPEETPLAEEPSSDDAIDAIVARFAPEATDETSPEEAPSSPQEAEEPPEAQTPQGEPGTPPAASQDQEPPIAAPTPAEPSPQDRNLAILAERQRAINAERERLQAERQSFQSERQTLERELAAFRAFQTKLQRDDALGALRDMGVDFDGLSRAVIEGRGTNPTSQLEEQMTARLTETEQRIQQRLDALQRAETQRLERAFQSEAMEAARTHSPLVASMGETGTQAIFAYFQQHAQAHPGEKLPSYEDAVRHVEKEALDFIRPMLETETVRGLIPRQPQDASPTLSNQQAAAAPTRTQEPEPTSYFDPYDDNEAVIDAIVRRHARK